MCYEMSGGEHVHMDRMRGGPRDRAKKTKTKRSPSFAGDPQKMITGSPHAS